MEHTWIKLYRKLLDSDIFRNEKLLKIWIWLLLRANHKDNTFLLGREPITVKRGQFVMGINKSSEVLNLAKSTIHYWVNYLNDIGKVELKKTNKYTVITIKNWDEYQGVELKKNSKRTLKETNKNDKECIKNDKEGNYSEETSQVVQEIVQEAKPISDTQIVFNTFYEAGNRGINFGNKTERAAAQWLVKEYGLEKTIGTIKFAMSVNGKPYAPVITTPFQLKNNMEKLKAYYKREQEPKKGSVPEFNF